MSLTANQKKLLNLLDAAYEKAVLFSEGYSTHFASGEEFQTALSESISKLKNGDFDQLIDLCLWFAPTCDWDDLVKKEGNDLANEIYPLLTKLKSSLNIYSIVDLITDYQETVEKVLNIFKQEFNVTNLIFAYRSNIIPQGGELKKFKIKNYMFHGIGLEVEFEDHVCLDFDFGIDQKYIEFELWQLQKFVLGKPDQYRNYLDDKKLEKDFNSLIEKGVIANSSGRYYFISDRAKAALSN